MIPCLLEAPVDIQTAEHDCVQANLAAAANALHGVRREHLLGAALGFRPRPIEEVVDATADATTRGLHSVERTLPEHLDDARRLLGLTAGAPRHELRGVDLVASIGTTWRLVVADAFTLPWVPYRGHVHTGHSFLLREADGDVELLDADTNDPPWGAARPTRWRLTRADLSRLLPDGPFTVAALGRAGPGVPADPPVAPTVTAIADDLERARDDGRVEVWVRGLDRHPDRTVAWRRATVETWLLARAHAAFARWLTECEPDRAVVDPAPARDRCARWAEAAEAVYLAMRRAERGRAVPSGVLEGVGELLRSDGAAVRACAPVVGEATGHDVRTVLVAVVSEVLGVDPGEVACADDLGAFPTFTSFRALDIVEGMECRLGIEVDPEDMVPAKLRRTEALTAMFSADPAPVSAGAIGDG